MATVADAQRLADVLTAATARDWNYEHVAPKTFVAEARRKWITIDGLSGGQRCGFLIVDAATGATFGIEAYGRPNRRHSYGLLHDLIGRAWYGASRGRAWPALAHVHVPTPPESKPGAAPGGER